MTPKTTALRPGLALAKRENRGLGRLSPVSQGLGARANALLDRGFAHALASAAMAPCFSAPFFPTGRFYRAKALFLAGRHEEFRRVARSFLDRHPTHVDGAFLYASLAGVVGVFDETDRQFLWDILAQQLRAGRREKIWLTASYLVDDPASFERMRQLAERAHHPVSPQTASEAVLAYFMTAALQAGMDEEAMTYARAALLEAVRTGAAASAKTASPFAARKAEKALREIVSALDADGIDAFPVSGTLLGLVRNDAILGHDKDVDIGVMLPVDRDRLYRAITATGKFWIQKSRSLETIRLKHVNGIAVDLFLHWQDDDGVWHGGVKAHWCNAPFTLERRDFSLGTFLVPCDTDRYLTENYGDWRTPNQAFDHVYDTPNARIVSEAEMLAHDYRMLAKAVHEDDAAAIARYHASLRARGQAEFDDGLRIGREAAS